MQNQSLPIPHLVGFNGYARTGKDTLAELLVSDYGYRRIAFADKLRNFIVAIDHEIAKLVEAVGWDEAKLDPQVRLALKDYGDITRNNIHENVWVFAALGDTTTTAELIAVSDVRFPNEADAIKDRGGRIVRVERPGVGPANNIDTLLDRYDKFDAVIQNDSTIEFLHARMHTLFEEWALVGSWAK